MITFDFQNNLTLQSLDVFVKVITPEQYASNFNSIMLSNPSMFSITLGEEYTLLMTSFPSEFGIEFKDVINAACYYYGDIDPVRSIVDDFVRPESIDQYLLNTTRATGSNAIATAYLETALLTLRDAITVINSKITELMTRVMAVAIEGIGSNYTVTAIAGPTVMFKRLTPMEVNALDAGDRDNHLLSVSDFIRKK